MHGWMSKKRSRRASWQTLSENWQGQLTCQKPQQERAVVSVLIRVNHSQPVSHRNWCVCPVYNKASLLRLQTTRHLQSTWILQVHGQSCTGAALASSPQVCFLYPRPLMMLKLVCGMKTKPYALVILENAEKSNLPRWGTCDEEQGIDSEGLLGLLRSNTFFASQSLAGLL